MKSKLRKNLITASAVLALSCVAVGCVASYMDEGAFDISAAKTASIVAAAESTTPTSNGSVVYVSPNVAYDSSYQSSMGTGTEADPYNISYLFADAGTLLSAGDTVVLIPGTYVIDTTLTINASGAYNNYITVINGSDYNSTKYSGDVVLSFYNMRFDSANRGIQLNGSYWYWYNIDVCGAGDNGFYIAGNYNIVENCEFYNNRDTGLQLGRAYSTYTSIEQWPSYNLIKNCSSYNNYDNETYGENADGFAAKLTVGYGNIFDGCIAYRNSDDGWDLYAKADTGNIGCVIIYNCVAFENGYLMESQATCNARYTYYNTSYNESDTSAYTTRDGDGNGFKLGGGVNEGDVILYNCMSFNNRMHGVTDNSNPGTLIISGVTSYNNGVGVASSGEISYTASNEECSNIDVARWDYSYNILSDVLSVIDDGAPTIADVYRGSAENSMFSANYITDNIDSYSADSNKCGTAYNSTYAKPTKAIFKATPELTMGIDCGTYDSATHQYEKTIHSQYRNDDGSINMGDILAVSDYTGLISDSVGCVLNESGWEKYTHYDYTLMSSCTSEDESKATAIKDMIYVPVNEDACYQDFDVVSHMVGYDITWTSSNSSVLSVGTDIETTTSSSQSIRIVVNRQAADTKVTLTAKVTVGSSTATKTFEINVKAANYEVGDIVADGVENDQIMLDQYRLVSEPSITVYDGSDNNGKTLDSSAYDIETTYMYAESRTSTFYQIAGFTTSKAGVYQITKTVTIKGADASDSTKTGSYTYYAYVSSTNTAITLSNASVIVNKEGFILEAEPSNVTGIVYVYVSSSALSSVTAETVVANGIATEYRTTDYSVQYENANSAGYYVYYVVTDISGNHVSEVYSAEVGTIEISDAAGFNAMLSSSDSTKIYVLTADIDFNNVTLSSSATFSAVLNGMGYTVKNVEATQCIFSSVKNGTIMNIKFDNITITAATNKVGIIAEMYGGYIYNVALTNISVYNDNNQRTGGLIGQIIATSGTSATTYIDNVSLVNDDDHIIQATNQRAGALVGFVQAGSAAGWNIIYISNCYVNATVKATQQVGGIVGTFDGRNANDYLSIKNCVVAGTLEATSSTSRIGGMLGYYNTGSGTMVIENCVTVADIVFGNVVLDASLKNASGIVGGYSTSADCTVTNCYAWFEDNNAEYEVTAISTAAVTRSNWWKNTVGLDIDGMWSMLYDTDGTTVIAPYVTLNYIA